MTDRARELLALVEAVPRSSLPGVIAAAAARLATEAEPASPTPTPAPRREPARWLTVAEVAARLGWNVRAVYRCCHAWDFTRRVGRKLRFDAAGLERWQEQQRLDP